MEEGSKSKVPGKIHVEQGEYYSGKLYSGRIPVGKGVPSKEELLKPLIFPNHPRAFQTFNGLLAFGITVYFVFFHEFPEKDHCFMPIRRFIKKQKEQFFRVHPEDQEYISQRAAELKKANELKKVDI